MATGDPMDRVVVVDHPLVQHKLSILRDERTGVKEFRELVRELAMLMAYEATRTFGLEATTVRTPIADAPCRVLAGKAVALVPVLRAGLGMVDGILQLLPNATVGHLGMFRDAATLDPVEYYAKLPHDLEQREVMLLDPMLATGGSAAAACRLVLARGAAAIKLLVILATPTGVRRVVEAAPGVQIYTCAVDPVLNGHAYIVPGLGDAGDRLFGTR